MKKNSLLIAALLLFTATTAFSQTSRVAHRSHSGKNNTFSALGEDHLGIPSGNDKMKPIKSDTLANPQKQDSTQSKTPDAKNKPAKDANRNKKKPAKKKDKSHASF